MARTTPAAVQSILGRNYTVNKDVAPFIATATVVVDDLVAEAATNALTVSAAKLERIECFLSAHFYGHDDQFFQSKSVEGASATFQGQFGKNLESSQYGQSAMMLDTTGYLARLNSGNKSVGFAWLGKYPSQQTDWIDKQ